MSLQAKVTLISCTFLKVALILEVSQTWAGHAEISYIKWLVFNLVCWRKESEVVNRLRQTLSFRKN